MFLISESFGELCSKPASVASEPGHAVGRRSASSARFSPAAILTLSSHAMSLGIATIHSRGLAGRAALLATMLE